MVTRRFHNRRRCRRPGRRIPPCPDAGAPARAQSGSEWLRMPPLALWRSGTIRLSLAQNASKWLRIAQNATPRALAIRLDPAQCCSECSKVAHISPTPPREPLWSGQTAGGAPRSGRTPTPPPFAHRMLLPPTAASGNGRRRALVRRFGGPPDEASRAAPHERGCWESPCGRPGLLTVLYHILLRLSSALLYFYSRHMTPHCLHL